VVSSLAYPNLLGTKRLSCCCCGNGKRNRGIPNLTWEESMKRDLKDWSITKELTLDRREWS
jgi:hypothetical protein